MSLSDAISNVPCLKYDTELTPNLTISPVVEEQLLTTPQAILWNNAGLYGLIPFERVKNAVILRNEKRGAGMEPTPLVFEWREVVELSPSQMSWLVSSTSRAQKPSPY